MIAITTSSSMSVNAGRRGERRAMPSMKHGRPASGKRIWANPHERCRTVRPVQPALSARRGPPVTWVNFGEIFLRGGNRSAARPRRNWWNHEHPGRQPDGPAVRGRGRITVPVPRRLAGLRVQRPAGRTRQHAHVHPGQPGRRPGRGPGSVPEMLADPGRPAGRAEPAGLDLPGRSQRRQGHAAQRLAPPQPAAARGGDHARRPRAAPARRWRTRKTCSRLRRAITTCGRRRRKSSSCGRTAS